MVKAERDKRIEENLGLVHACAARFKGRGVEYDDLFQAGCVGLCKAADGFDESKGFAFSTYAVPTILGEMRRIFRDGGTVKVGRTIKEKSRKLLQVQEQLTNTLGRAPSITELAREAGVERTQAAFLLNAALPAVSLTMDSEESDAQTDIPVPPPDTDIEDRLTLHRTMQCLTEQERELIELRFYKGFTQTRTAEVLQISQVQVSRKEKAILSKMRRLFYGT